MTISKKDKAETAWAGLDTELRSNLPKLLRLALKANEKILKDEKESAGSQLRAGDQVMGMIKWVMEQEAKASPTPASGDGDKDKEPEPLAPIISLVAQSNN